MQSRAGTILSLTAKSLQNEQHIRICLTTREWSDEFVIFVVKNEKF